MSLIPYDWRGMARADYVARRVQLRQVQYNSIGMNIGRIYRQTLGGLIWLPLAALWIRPVNAGPMVEDTFAVLKTRTGTYTNVTVTTKTKDWIFILHSAGMVNIKIQDLPLDAQQKLGYAAIPAPPPPEPVKATNNISKDHSPAKPTVPNVTAHTGTTSPHKKSVLARIKDLINDRWQKLRTYQRAETPRIPANRAVFFVFLGISVLFYLFFCNCCRLICRKANVTPGILAWLPGLQLLPLLSAAKMSLLWFLVFLAPGLAIFLAKFLPAFSIFLIPVCLFVQFIAQIIWSVNIVRARGKSMWVALFLILPFTNLFAFLYLAFSSDTPIEVKSAPDIMVLGTS
jgi:hypothetical protein